MQFAESTQHDTSKVLRLPRKMTTDTSKVLRLPPKLQRNVAKVLRLPHKTTFDVTKHIWMSRIATPATRNEATRRLNLQKWPLLQNLPQARSYRSSRGRLRTIADGCERLRTVANGCERLRTPSAPRPPEWNGNPCYAFGKNALVEPCGSPSDVDGVVERIARTPAIQEKWSTEGFVTKAPEEFLARNKAHRKAGKNIQKHKHTCPWNPCIS